MTRKRVICMKSLRHGAWSAAVDVFIYWIIGLVIGGACLFVFFFISLSHKSCYKDLEVFWNVMASYDDHVTFATATWQCSLSERFAMLFMIVLIILGSLFLLVSYIWTCIE